MPSVEPVSQDIWEEMRSIAETRIDQYQSRGRENEDYLPRALNAALNWQPGGAREELADDIKKAKDDQTLWEIYDNLRTAVIETREFASSSVHDSYH